MKIPGQISAKINTRKLFQAHFGQVWPAEWPVHEGQTPGDFAVVAHRARLLSERESAVLLRWLREEIEARGDHSRGVMGFHVPRASGPMQRLKPCEQEAA